MAIYEAAPITFDVITVLSDPAQRDPVRVLSKKYRKSHIRKALALLAEQEIIRQPDEPLPSKPVLKKTKGMRHLELMVTHGCNMGCRLLLGRPWAGRLGQDHRPLWNGFLRHVT